MADFTISKDMTAKGAKDATKAEVYNEVIWNALVAAYGEDNVRWVRTGSATSPKNEIAVRAKTVDVGDGFETAVCVTVSAAAKDFSERKTDKKGTIPAFDFDAAAQRYDDYLIEKETKAADKAAAKEKKIASDEKRRAAKAQG